MCNYLEIDGLLMRAEALATMADAVHIAMAEGPHDPEGYLDASWLIATLLKENTKELRKAIESNLTEETGHE